MNLQSELLRRRDASDSATPKRLQSPFLAIGGGKGGVGKTTFAANLGLALSARGHRVLLVDLDFGLANLDVALGLQPGRRIDEALSGAIGFAQCIQAVERGLDLLPAASGDKDLALGCSERRGRIRRALIDLSMDYDLVIGDSAAGIGPDVLEFSCLADVCLLVTTPDPAAIADAYGVLKALDAHGDETGVELPTPEIVVNCAAGAHEAQAVAERLAAVAERFLSRRPRLAGWLPRATAVERAGRERRPFVGDGASPPARAIQRLADRLERSLNLGTGGA